MDGNSTSSIEINESAPLLEVQDLIVEYETNERGTLRAIDEVSFTIESDETFGLIGESGCGKSTIAKAILGILPRNGNVVGGAIEYKGVDLTGLSTEELNEFRWEHVSMISQDASNALNPVHKISTQIVEAIRVHRDVSKSAARDRVRELFELVELDPDRMDEYPHEFSGGMKQRAYIAMSLALDPALIVADEPTTALDVIVQDKILERLQELQDELGVSLMLITHDVSVVTEVCQRMGVMYAGKMMEYGALERVFEAPHNPYTLGLQNAFPSLTGEQQDLISISGSPPSLAELPVGCRFVDRCPFSDGACRHEHPRLERVGGDHYSACHRHDDVEEIRNRATEVETWQTGQ